ncbi:hypothetical protein EDD21DRAFT_49941 [Dissophora ornata]|nr:hypothetical protein EDD21DRAFT_49941 [Dissophora ornata]
MIQLLQDNQLKTKINTDQLVASLDSQKIIHEYGPRLTAAESEVCSMAESILIRCMLSQEQDGSLGEGFASFIEYIRDTSRIGSLPKREMNRARSPEQLLSMAKITTGNLVNQDMNNSSNNRETLVNSLFRVIAKLGEAIPRPMWANFIGYLTLKTYGCPTDPLLIRIWSNFAPSLASSPEAIASLSTTILNIMDGQGVLTEDMLNNALETSDEALDYLRLARLSPLLILKTVSSRGFADEYKIISTADLRSQIDSIPERMLASLRSRSDNRLEFSMVKTLAKTICHDMFPDSSLEAIYRGMAIQFSCKPFHVEDLDFVDARSWLFALYDWIRNWSSQSTSLEKNGHDIAWIYRIVSDFLYEITAIATTMIGLIRARPLQASTRGR